MKVKFWGTRGSLPQATSNNELLSLIDDLIQEAQSQGIRTLRTFNKSLANGDLGKPIVYGGNTTCTEIIHGDKMFFVDMGSGLREAGTHYMPKGVKEFHIFLTHMHWDHIMGLPFFVPVHAAGCTIKIYHVHRNAPEYVKINFNGVNFPLTFEQLGGKIEFEQLTLYQPKDFGDIKVTPFVLDHPGGCFGFRFDTGTQAIAVGVDGEYKRITRAQLGKDLPYYQNLDLLIFDAQYEISELASRFDWGHSSPNIGVELAVREGIKHMVFTHHDPWSTPVKLRRMNEAAHLHLATMLPSHQAQWTTLGKSEGPTLSTAYDGFVIEL